MFGVVKQLAKSLGLVDAHKRQAIGSVLQPHSVIAVVQ